MKEYPISGEVIHIHLFTNYQKEALIVPAYVVDVEKHENVDLSKSTVTCILYTQNRLLKTYCSSYTYEKPTHVKILSDYVILPRADEELKSHLPKWED